MKKLFGMLGIFLALGLTICLVMGFCSHVPEEIVKSSVFGFKLLTGFEYLIKYFPGLIIMGFVISCSVHFGHNPEGSSYRFSKAMFDRFKIVIISSIIISAILTLNSEVFGILISNRKAKIINRPKVIAEYVQVGNNLFEHGFYDRALLYADAALKLNSNDEAAINLKEKSEVEQSRSQNANMRFKLYESVEEARNVDEVKIDSTQIYEVFTYYQKAKEAYENEQWFNAHYYAELGLKLATPKDPNLDSLKELSTMAWNNLTEKHSKSKTEEQKIFDRKYEGYLALVQKDDLKAYYIFRELYSSSRELQSDPDVSFYLEIAENRINEKYFFIDETFELQTLESANNVYFSYDYADGSTDLVFFKGVTTVAGTGNSIQYLRDLTIKTIGKDGYITRTMQVPYAKVLPVSIEGFNSITKSLLGIDEHINFIPYILLNSVGRDNPEISISPEYSFAPGHEAQTPDYLLLPIDYEDFVMLENASNDPYKTSLTNLYKLIKRSEMYGFSEEVYGQIFINRVMYALWMIFIMILLASFAWNNRIEPTQYFKLTWAFAFPIFFVVAFEFYRLAYFVLKLINYAVLARFDFFMANIASFVIILLFLLIGTIIFLARRSKK
ncbi:MAG: hypothetical protein PUC37_00235 [Spirochaetales bacterium]|nr:hypothetical protein [Spirochaetales bacterium]